MKPGVEIKPRRRVFSRDTGAACQSHFIRTRVVHRRWDSHRAFKPRQVRGVETRSRSQVDGAG